MLLELSCCGPSSFDSIDGCDMNELPSTFMSSVGRGEKS